MFNETKDRVAEKIDEISKSISNTEAGTGAERNLVNNMVLLAKLQQEDEKQSDIRTDDQAKRAMDKQRFEYEKAKDAKELDFKKECENTRMAEFDKKVETDYIKFEEELRFKTEQEQNRKSEADGRAKLAEAELDFKKECEQNRRAEAIRKAKLADAELEFKAHCEENRKAEEIRRRSYEKDRLRLDEDELEFKRECERNRHEEAMKKIEAELAEAQAKREFEQFKFEQDYMYRRMEVDARRKEWIVDAAKVGLGTAVGIGSLMATIYTVKAACTVDKDFDAMPSKTLQSLMIRGIQKINI